MKLLISACLMGTCCRYNGTGIPLEKECLKKLLEAHTLIPVCPEILGGLPTPRPPAERQGERVVNRAGEDVTAQFEKGAQETLALAQLLGCKAAILKEKSPSCGKDRIYDGSFAGRLQPGEGVTAALLRRNGIEVYGESEILRFLGGKIV